MNATRKEKKMRKLIAVAALAAALAACGGSAPTGLHDPAKLAAGLEKNWTPDLDPQASCTELDNGTFTCTVTISNVGSESGTYVLHAQVSKDGQTAEVTSDHFDTIIVHAEVRDVPAG
jgi:uncharacterized membrane protein